MTSVLVGMLVIVGLAVVVLALVAIPSVREGEKILTPDGETAMRDARRRAQAMAEDARRRAVATRNRPAVRAAAPSAEQPEQPGPPIRTPEPEPASMAVPVTSADREADGEADGEDVVDLRESRRIDLAARERIARALEWGAPEPGPRHRR